MASLDEIFFKEFQNMMYQRKGITGQVNLNDIPLPPGSDKHLFVETRDKVRIIGIQEEYFSKLDGTEALLWGRSQLQRRKFDYRGEFMRDKDGNYILQEVTCPHDCVAVISKESIGVPNSFKSKEQSSYVDMITRKTQSGEMHRFVYIVPRKYCYKVKQTALVLSWNKLRRFYQGIGLSMQNGSTLFMYVIPYSPTSKVHNYRVLHCKSSVDYTQEITVIKNFWINSGVIFNPAECQLTDFVRGRENMAYFNLDSTEDVYEVFDASKPLGEDDTLEDVEFID